MGPKKTNNRFKIKCLECGVSMDNDYRMKHNRLFHSEMLKQHKSVRWQKADASKNPFEAASSRPPAKVPHIGKESTSKCDAASTSIVDESTSDAVVSVAGSSIVDESTSVTVPTVNSRLSCDSNKMRTLFFISRETCKTELNVPKAPPNQ